MLKNTLINRKATKKVALALGDLNEKVVDAPFYLNIISGFWISNFLIKVDSSCSEKPTNSSLLL